MDLQKSYVQGLLSALSVFAYTVLVAWFMFNAESFLGQVDTFWTPVAILMLFVASATIVGLIVLGRPIYLFMSERKIEAFVLLTWTVSWLVAFIVIVLAFQLS